MNEAVLLEKPKFENAQKYLQTGCCDSSTLCVLGHYFSACYLKDTNNNANWYLIDIYSLIQDSKNVRMCDKFDFIYRRNGTI